MGRVKRWGWFMEGMGSRNQIDKDKGLTRSVDQGLEGNDQIWKLAEETGR